MTQDKNEQGQESPRSDVVGALISIVAEKAALERELQQVRGLAARYRVALEAIGEHGVLSYIIDGKTAREIARDALTQEVQQDA